MAQPEDLRERMDALLFPGDDERVIVAIQVVKVEGKKKKIGGASRFLCVTAQKNKERKTFILRLHHVVKTSGVFQLKKSWHFHDLRRVDSFADADFALGLNKTVRFSAVLGATTKYMFLWALMQLWKSAHGKYPQTNLDMVELRLMAEAQGFHKDYLEFARAMLAGDVHGADTTVPQMQQTLISTQEEHDMQMLLGECGMDLGDAAKFADALTAMIGQLEYENVLSILESEQRGTVDEVVSQLDHAFLKLTEVGVWLRGFTPQMEQLGRDMDVMRARNSTLELQTSNYRKLLDVLSGLLHRLALPSGVVSTLRRCDTTTGAARTQLKHACDKLRDALDMSEMNDELLQMDAVRTRRSELLSLVDGMATKLLRDVGSAFHAQADAFMHNASVKGEAQHIKPPNHALMHSSLMVYAPLLHVLKELSAEHHESARKLYTDAVSPVYVKEIQAFASNLRTRIVRGSKKPTPLLGVPSRKNVKEPLKRLKSHASITTLGTRAATTVDLLSDGLITPLSGVTSHDGLCYALRVFTPLLVREEHACRELFGYAQPGEAEQGGGAENETTGARGSDEREVLTMMHALLDVVTPSLNSLCDMQHMNLFQLMYLVVESSEYIATYENKSPFLIKVLTDLQMGMKSTINVLTEQQLSSISEFKSRTKQSGLLPFFASFPDFVDHVEDVTRGSWRGVAGTVYHKLTQAMFSKLEKLANAQTKYRSVLLTHNAFFLWTALNGRDVPELAPSVEKARSMALEQLDVYVMWLLTDEWGELWDLMHAIDELLSAGMHREEVQFQTKYSHEVVRKAVHAFAAHLKSSVSHIHTRVHKHLGEQSQLCALAWSSLQTHLMDMYTHFEDLMLSLYDIVLSPSASEVRALIEAAKAREPSHV